ncbi:MAG: hypothetical protein ACI8QZ_001981 [Chlamydiales bacterium]|jgi:hypothetical protein
MGSRIFPASVALIVLLAGATAAWRQSGPNAGPPPAPVEISSAFDLIMAQPFQVDEAFVHTWRAEAALVQAGYLLVLDVDPTYVRPRQGLEPVLYVGTQTAERVNTGFPSGRVVALVPAPLDGQGLPDLDLENARIWFGSPALPERIDMARIELEHARASDAGVEPLASARVRSAIRRGATQPGALTHFADRTALERYAAQQILVFAPDEAELARGILAPLVR